MSQRQEPGHQQAWYWPSKPEYMSLASEELIVVHPWFRWWLCAKKVTSHYLNQGWYSLDVYESSRLSELAKTIAEDDFLFLMNVIFTTKIAKKCRIVYHFCLYRNLLVMWHTKLDELCKFLYFLKMTCTQFMNLTRYFLVWTLIGPH